MNILALDMATKTGWCSPTSSGTWNLKAKRDESAGMRNVNFRKYIREIFDTQNIDLVVYERVAGQHKQPLIVAGNLEATLTNECIDRGIDYKAYSAGEIKKHATGKGNSGKAMMIIAATEEWPDLKIVDDNHADALWLHDLATKEYA